MKNIMKYVINNQNEPILFSRNLVHNQITENVISAGFTKITFDENTKSYNVVCFGESSTLKLKSNSLNDKEIIEAFINEKNFVPQKDHE